MTGKPTTDLEGLLGELDELVKVEIASTPEVVAKTSVTADSLPKPGTRTWFKLENVYAVVCDLKGSTALGTGKHDSSTASIYEASTGGAVKVLHKYAADFIAIQGDGAFGLFWGDRALERAVCAGITIKTFSERYLVPQMVKRWPDGPETGFKVGMASGRVLSKLIGTLRTPDEQEPVWAGKPVNYATKAAQAAQRHQMVVTAAVWKELARIDYLRFSCGCTGGVPGTPTDALWADAVIEAIPEDRDDRNGKLLTAAWCVNHGEEYAAHILAGDRDNPATAQLRAKVVLDEAAVSLQAKRDRQAADLRSRRQGLS